eukprot:9497478-Pyramimonas_sp.AAC.1
MGGEWEGEGGGDEGSMSKSKSNTQGRRTMKIRGMRSRTLQKTKKGECLKTPTIINIMFVTTATITTRSRLGSKKGCWFAFAKFFQPRFSLQ